MPFLNKKKMRYKVKSHTTPVDEEKQKQKSIEDKFYWTRALVGALVAIIGTVGFHFVGWVMLAWMGGFLLGFPWIMSFVIFRIPYVKGKWDWKHILKTGIGAYFFIFMLIATILHTIIVMNDPELNYAEIFANPREP